MKSPKVGFVSLGCPKALVDSERILTQLKTEGYDVASDYDGADLVVVNTCGFIESAVQESLDAIGEAMSANGRVIVPVFGNTVKDGVFSEWNGQQAWNVVPRFFRVRYSPTTSLMSATARIRSMVSCCIINPLHICR